MDEQVTHTARRRYDGDVGIFLGRVEVARVCVDERTVTVDLRRPEGFAVLASDATVEEAVARFGPAAAEGLRLPARHRRGDGAPLIVLGYLRKHRERIGIDPQGRLTGEWAAVAHAINRRSEVDPHAVYEDMRETLPDFAQSFWEHHHYWGCRKRGEFLDSLPWAGDAVPAPEEARPEGRFLEVRRLGTDKVARRVEVTGKTGPEVEAVMRGLLRSLGRGLYVADTAEEATPAEEGPMGPSP